MIFRTCVMVACAVPEEFTDAVAYAFGVNARDSSEAIRMTIEAAKDAVDREGRYIGGVVIEVASRYAYPQEFESSNKYFHRPMSEPGIFYVTGVTYTGVARPMPADLAKELDAAKERVTRSGYPSPSFTHPKLPEEPPTSVRMVCSVCAHWVQVSNAGLVFSDVSELDLDSREGKEATANRFMVRHFHCGGKIEEVHEDDPRWNELDENKREDENAHQRGGALGSSMISATRTPIAAAPPNGRELIGVWSRGAFEETDGPWEWFLTFRADGTGRYDDGNYGNYVAQVFRWTCERAGHVTVRASQWFRYSMIDPVSDITKATKEFVDVPFIIRTETTRLGRRIPVLRATLFGFSPKYVGFGLEKSDVGAFPLEVRVETLGAPR